jgi:2-oxoisovalerate dehydrogenase E1 component
MVQETNPDTPQKKNTLTVITYGMGVYWALNACAGFEDQVEIVDLRTINPVDEETVFASVRKNSRCLVLTEEQINNSFARALAGLIQEKCFTALDAPVMTMGAENMPAIPLNSTLEQTMLPSAEKVRVKLLELLEF